MHKNGHLYFISGTEQGTLAAAQDVRDVGTAYSSIFGSGDMTGDGIGDVAARDRTGGGIHILSGNGAGGFGDTLGKFTGATNVKPLSGARMAGSSHSDLVGAGLDQDQADHGAAQRTQEREATGPDQRHGAGSDAAADTRATGTGTASTT